MYTRRWLLVGLLAWGLLTAQEGQPTVQVTGAVKHPLTLSAEDLAKMPRASVCTTNQSLAVTLDGKKALEWDDSVTLFDDFAYGG